MRREVFYLKRYDAAKRRAPWAAIIVKCQGGFIAFESMQDFKIWKGLK